MQDWDVWLSKPDSKGNDVNLHLENIYLEQLEAEGLLLYDRLQVNLERTRTWCEFMRCCDDPRSKSKSRPYSSWFIVEHRFRAVGSTRNIYSVYRSKLHGGRRRYSHPSGRREK